MKLVKACLVGCLCFSLAKVTFANTVIDDRGTEISVTAVQPRVATISTFGADLLVAMGMTPVAVTTFGPLAKADFLSSKLSDVPVIGSRSQVNMELLSEVAPDLILAIKRYTEKNADQFNHIAPYMALDLVTLDDSFRGVKLSGEILGQGTKADELNQAFQKELLLFQRKAPGGVSAALLVTSAETPFIYYEHFISAQILNYLKAKNIAGASKTPKQRLPLGYRISLEQLLTADPDVIFLLASNKKRAFTLNPIWPYLKAVKNDRVYEVGHHWKEAAGPQARRMVLQEMAHRLYPDTFTMPKLPAQVKSQPYR